MPAAHPSPVRVLFVCMGNICRSPVAEGLFRSRIEEAGLAGKFHCDSAVTHSYHVGNPPDPRSVAAARSAGLDISSQRSRVLSADDFRSFQWIICMDGENLSHIRQSFGDTGTAQVRTLFEDEEVADPYYGGEQGFSDMLEHLQRGIDDLIDHLQSGN